MKKNIKIYLLFLITKKNFFTKEINYLFSSFLGEFIVYLSFLKDKLFSNNIKENIQVKCINNNEINNFDNLNLENNILINHIKNNRIANNQLKIKELFKCQLVKIIKKN